MTAAVLKLSGTTTSDKEQFTSSVIDGSRMSLHSFTRKVDQESNKHDLVGEFAIMLEISSYVTGLKDGNTGGSAGGLKSVAPSKETKLLRIFKILSLKLRQNNKARDLSD